MKIPIYQVDAFTSEVFFGNPAAVCILDGWLEYPVLQCKIYCEVRLVSAGYVPIRPIGVLAGKKGKVNERTEGT